MRFQLLFTTILSAVAASASTIPVRRGGVTVDLAAIQEAVNRLNEATSTLYGLSDGIKQSLNPIISVSGASSESLNTALTVADDSASKLAATWGEIAQTLNNAGDTFSDSENDAANMWSRDAEAGKQAS